MLFRGNAITLFLLRTLISGTLHASLRNMVLQEIDDDNPACCIHRESQRNPLSTEPHVMTTSSPGQPRPYSLL